MTKKGQKFIKGPSTVKKLYILAEHCYLADIPPTLELLLTLASIGNNCIFKSPRLIIKGINIIFDMQNGYLQSMDTAFYIYQNLIKVDSLTSLILRKIDYNIANHKLILPNVLEHLTICYSR
jgi:hypothetical protein